MRVSLCMPCPSMSFRIHWLSPPAPYLTKWNASNESPLMILQTSSNWANQKGENMNVSFNKDLIINFVNTFSHYVLLLKNKRTRFLSVSSHTISSNKWKTVFKFALQYQIVRKFETSFKFSSYNLDNILGLKTLIYDTNKECLTKVILNFWCLPSSCSEQLESSLLSLMKILNFWPKNTTSNNKIKSQNWQELLNRLKCFSIRTKFQNCEI